MAEAGGDNLGGSIAGRPDRGVVLLAGPDAATFLHGVVTNTVKTVEPGEGRFGALLSPQGKVLFDFFMTRTDDGFLFEIARDLVADFVKRLGFYRLRAKVTITDLSQSHDVFVVWGRPAPELPGAVTFADPRLPALGHHLIVPTAVGLAATTDVSAWHVLRIGLGVPESGIDFPLGEFFPHDVDMDDLDGVDFKKGCFVGQEVVSRMKHRGTARRRFILARTVSPHAQLPTMGAEVVAGGRGLGTLGSSIDGVGLASVRLDRAREARDAGEPITAEGVELTLELPTFAHFGWPEAGAGE